MQELLLSYAAPRKKMAATTCCQVGLLFPDSVAKLKSTDVLGQNLAKQSGSSCATAALGFSAERLAVLRGPTDARKPIS